MRRCLVLCASLAVACTSTPSTSSSDAAAQVESHTAWRSEREASLRSPTGYLALTGLLWLEEGRHTLGGDEGSDLALPAGRVPARVGELVVDDGRVVLEVARGVEVRVDGELVERVELAPDTSGERTLIETGELSFWLIERAGALGLRVRDPASPILAGFEGIEAYRYDPKWVVEARFELTEGATLAVPNVLGSVYPEASPGAIVFEVAGHTGRLACTGDPADGLFCVFGDATNGRATYGGGRFLSLPPPSADGRVSVDFNRAYNPPCAISPFTTCPLPPDGNVLPFEVTAGERAPR